MKVRVSTRADAQINSALKYVALKSPQGAGAIGRRLAEVLQLLADRPELGRNLDEPGLRRIPLRPYLYLVDYVVQGDELIVLRFRHAARRP